MCIDNKYIDLSLFANIKEDLMQGFLEIVSGKICRGVTGLSHGTGGAAAAPGRRGGGRGPARGSAGRGHAAPGTASSAPRGGRGHTRSRRAGGKAM